MRQSEEERNTQMAGDEEARKTVKDGRNKGNERITGGLEGLML